MEDVHHEQMILGSPLFSYNEIEKIKEQMRKNICAITNGNKGGTGFFAKIPFPDKENMLPVLITNNHVLDKSTFDKKIILTVSGTNISIDLSFKRMKITFETFDITIIEILKEDKLDNYLDYSELDDLVINNIINDENQNKEYNNKDIYIIQYAKGELSVSFGIMKDIHNDKNYFFHTCSTEDFSSGSPIIGINNKIIGIHCGKAKNNSNIGIFLNLAIKEFNEMKNDLALIKFNVKYKTQIKDTKVEEIIITNPSKLFKRKGLLDLTQIFFNKLKILDLSENNISKIDFLEKNKFPNLEHLILTKNKIENIEPLEKTNLDELKELDLGKNKIKDIAVLKNVKFDKLEKLKLDKNEISSIDVLKEANFNELKELEIGKNKIKDISVFKKVKFDKLEILKLEENGIESIEALKEANFNELKELDLFKNQIKDIEPLGAQSVKFDKLEKLNLGKNGIESIDKLEKAKFNKNLIELNLIGNIIKNIKGLINFEKLENLNLKENKISDISPLKDAKFIDSLKEINLKINNINNIDILKDLKFDNKKKPYIEREKK